MSITDDSTPEERQLADEVEQALRLVADGRHHMAAANMAAVAALVLARKRAGKAIDLVERLGAPPEDVAEYAAKVAGAFRQIADSLERR